MKSNETKNLQLTTLLPPVGFAIMFLLVLLTQQYKLYDIEQTRVFVYYSKIISEQLGTAGGPADVAALWLQQFFVLPLAGPLIMAALSTLLAIILYNIVSRLGGTGLTWKLIAWIPAMLLFIYTEARLLFIVGHVAIVFSVIGLWIYGILRAKNKIIARITLMALVPFIGWSASTCVWVMVIGAILISFYYKDYIAIGIALLASILMIVLALHFCLVTNSTEIFSPDIYSYRLRINTIMPWIWASTILVVLVPVAMKSITAWLAKNKVVMPIIVFVALLFTGYSLFKNYHDEIQYSRIKMQQDMREGNYDKVLSFCSENIRFLYASNIYCQLLSMNKDVLPQMAKMNFTATNQIILGDSQDVIIRQLLMNIYYHVGYILGAQREAFEFNEPMDGMMRPDALKILAKTNIIMGNYATAEKYLDHLSHTLFYKDWAEKHRKFLYNDKAVEDDEELGPRRKALGFDSVSEQWTTIPHIIRQIAFTSPSLPATEYFKAFKEIGAYDDMKKASKNKPINIINNTFGNE